MVQARCLSVVPNHRGGRWGIDALANELQDAYIDIQPVRSFYYTSTVGADDERLKVREALWELGFTPEVFKKKNKEIKAKSVDIAMTKDVLSNAFLNNYDVAVLITGDADYQPVIQEVKRLGKIVQLLSLVDTGANVSPEPRLSADWFMGLDELFLRGWRQLPENRT